MKVRNLLCVILAAALLSGCCGVSFAAEESETETVTEKKEKEELPVIGESIAGFTLTDVGQDASINADMLFFHHEKSGADLLYIKNDDTNLGFAVGYRTPLLSEAGFNHVFEHAITAASKKYPSKDVFFDMNGSTYNTYLNAFTGGTYTSYPLSSQSEEQLKKMADVYLDCMTEPLVIEDENYFRREAIRYQLYDKADPITMTGIVFSEDFGRLTDRDNALITETMKALNPGMPSYEISRSDLHYAELTYDGLKETYDRFYHFDNALILLYGDMDYHDFMEYLDESYLSGAQTGQTATEYFKDYPAKEGYTEKVIESPAYEGDTQEAVIGYSVDIGDASWTDMQVYDLIAAVLQLEQSPLNQKLREAGLPGTAFAGSFSDYEEHFFSFILEDTDADAADKWKQIVDETVAEMLENGLEDSLVKAVMNAEEMNELLLREWYPSELFAQNLAGTILNKWAQTGKADYYRDSADAVRAMEEDPQKQIRVFAQMFQDQASRALLTAVPTPGLAEEVEASQEQYLADMKASMTDEELDQMIADTLAFDEWNESELSNHDFMISAEDLPEPEKLPPFVKEETDGFTSYASATDKEGISYNRVVFSTDSVAQEDLHDLALYAMLVYVRAMELEDSVSPYLFGLNVEASSLNRTIPEENLPVLQILWYSRPEDYEQALACLMDLLQNPLYEDGEELVWRLDMMLPSLNEGNTADETGLAFDLANAYFYPNSRYDRYLNGQEFYRYVKDLRDRLDEDADAAAEEISERLDKIREQVLNKNGLIVANVAPEDVLEQMKEANRKTFVQLTEKNSEPAAYDLPAAQQKQAAICSLSSYTDMIFLPLDTAEFPGRYIPFIYVLSDQYLTPVLRLQNGAYGGNGTVANSLCNAVMFYSYRDPNVKETYEIYQETPDVLQELELSEEELEGYIISAYGSFTLPEGSLNNHMRAVTYDMAGVDYEAIRTRIGDILNAKTTDKDAAAALLRDRLDEAAWITVGNAQKIRENADLFGSLEDFRE